MSTSSGLSFPCTMYTMKAGGFKLICVWYGSFDWIDENETSIYMNAPHLMMTSS